jgi:hypothetical protein
MVMTPIPVQCCWATVGAQLVRFQVNGKDLLVEEVLDQWSGKDCSFLKLRADDGNLYVLRRDSTGATMDNWALTSFRKDAGLPKA